MQLESKDKAPMAREGSRGRLIMFGIFALAAGLFFGVWGMLADTVAPTIIKPDWNRDFQAGEKLMSSDPSQAKRLIGKAFDEASKTSVVNQMQLHHRYANDLYRLSRYDEADAQIDQAIKLFHGDPNKPSGENDALTHIYQDRGWQHHLRYLDDNLQDPGLKDQQMSVEVAQKAFGPDHEQTVYKLSALGVIESDLGHLQRAQAIFDRITKAVDTKDSAKPAGWFVYASLSRSQNVQGQYAQAVQSFSHALQLCHDKNQINRATEEFTCGFDNNKQAARDADIDNASSLLADGKYAELDQLANRLRTSKIAEASGYWKLDRFYDKLSPRDESGSDYTQILYELKKWLAQNPQSPTARVALAAAYIHYAWQARGGGYASTVSDESWKLFSSRLAQAQQTLDGSPDLKKRCPRAFAEYSSLAQGQSWDKKKYMALVDECHHLYPTYYTIDLYSTYFLLPRWYGDAGEVENFITSRADSLGGAAGDKLYAQLVSHVRDYLDEPVGKNSLVSWARVKSGFKQIFADYPKSAGMRATFVRMAAAAGDLDSVKTVLTST